MKTHLNPEIAAVAKCNLSKEDIKEIAELSNLKESKIALIISGRSKGKPETIDLIIDRAKKRLDLNKLKLEA